MHGLFEPIIRAAMEVFDPEAVVLQCGADSLYGDRLARLKLSVNGHANCFRYIRSFNKPLLLGGGGYTINHVASCWCYETAIAVGKDIADDIPHHGYDHFYKEQGYKLHYYKSLSRGGTEKDMEKIRQRALEHLSQIEPVPSVQFEEPRGWSGGIGDVIALYDDHPPSEEEEDPMERLHRLCGEVDLASFFLDLGKRQKIS